MSYGNYESCEEALARSGGSRRRSAELLNEATSKLLHPDRVAAEAIATMALTEAVLAVHAELVVQRSLAADRA